MLHSLCGGLEAAVFIKNHNSECITCLHYRILMRIMAGTVSVSSHLATEFDFVTADIVRNSFAGESEVKMGADAFVNTEIMVNLIRKELQ